uniref:Uncharacterized protein n=1 Tax=Romanomermis culicivorax TaxID=13658 RepID=A0A915KMU8_ROMCU
MKPKTSKKKKKKLQLDEWKILSDVSNDDHSTLQPKMLWDDLKQLQAVVATTMQGKLMMHLHDLIRCPVLLI